MQARTGTNWHSASCCLRLSILNAQRSMMFSTSYMWSLTRFSQYLAKSSCIRVAFCSADLIMMAIRSQFFFSLPTSSLTPFCLLISAATTLATNVARLEASDAMTGSGIISAALSHRYPAAVSPVNRKNF